MNADTNTQIEAFVNGEQLLYFNSMNEYLMENSMLNSQFISFNQNPKKKHSNHLSFLSSGRNASI